MRFYLSFFALVALFFCNFSSAKSRKSSTPRKPATYEYASSDTSYLQRILSIEHQRIAKDRFLVACLSHSSRRVVKAALMALGRIGDTSALDEMARFLSRKDADYADTAAFALSIIGGETAPKILTQSLVFQKNPAIRASILLGIGRTGNENVAGTLYHSLLKETDTELLDKTAEGIALSWSGATDKWVVPQEVLLRLAKLSLATPPLSISAASALSRYKGDPKQLPLQDLLNSLAQMTPPARALILRTIGKIQNPQVAAVSAAALSKESDLGVRIEAANALRFQITTPSVMEILKQAILFDKSKAVIHSALTTLGKYGPGAQGLTNEIEIVIQTNPSIWIRSTALKTLARVNPEKAKKLISDWIKDPKHPLFKAAVSSHALLGNEGDLSKIASLMGEFEIPVIVDLLEEMTSIQKDLFSSDAKDHLKRLLLKNDMGITALVAQMVEQYEWKEFTTLLVSSLPLYTQEDHVEARIGILNALSVVGDKSSIPVLETALNDKSKGVVTAAANALKKITGKDYSHKIPLNSKIGAPVPQWTDLQSSLQKQVVIRTTRGDITVKMSSAAPATANWFIHFSRTGFYDGKSFHRVVPNFVVQGGDPRGDGFGGPGFLIRDEVSAKRHERGTLGVATAGKDTGGCQFFFNTATNLHLAGKYTLFAEVLSGMDVVDSLEVGDKIISTKVK